MNQRNTDRRKHIAWIFLPVIIAIAIQTAASFMVMEFYMVESFASYESGTYTDFIMDFVKKCLSDTSSAMISILYAVVTAVVMFMLFRSRYRDGKLESLRGKSKNVPLTIVGLILFVISMQYVTEYLLQAFSASFPEWLEEYQQMMDMAGMDENITVPLLLYAVLFGPICEELIFRGVTFYAARKVMPVHFAILVQAILFGTFHMNKLQAMYAFVIGLGLGYIMYIYDNLWLTIIAHILYNILGSTSIPTGGNTLISFFLLTLTSLVATYVSIIILRKGSALVKSDDFFADI